jgi:hypothetical protein
MERGFRPAPAPPQPDEAGQEAEVEEEVTEEQPPPSDSLGGNRNTEVANDNDLPALQARRRPAARGKAIFPHLYRQIPTHANQNQAKEDIQRDKRLVQISHALIEGVILGRQHPPDK